MKYDTLSKYGLNWAGLIPVDTGYVWTPERYVQGINKENILGIEAPLWSKPLAIWMKWNIWPFKDDRLFRT